MDKNRESLIRGIAEKFPIPTTPQAVRRVLDRLDEDPEPVVLDGVDAYRAALDRVSGDFYPIGLDRFFDDGLWELTSDEWVERLQRIGAKPAIDF